MKNNNQSLIFDIKKEFNNITHFNNLCKKEKDLGNKSIIQTEYKFRSCFPDADEIWVIEGDELNTKNSENINNESSSILQNRLNSIELISKNNRDKKIIKNLSSYKSIVNQYKESFSYTENQFKIQKDDFNWCLSSEEYYEKYKNKKPYVVINSRNYNKTNGTSHYNRSYYKIIEKLVNNGMYVINTTLNPYGLKFRENYEEIDCTNDYSEMVAIFQCANCVFHISDSAAINQNLTIKSNVVLLSNGIAFVDNPEFGNIYDSRKGNCKSVVTDKIMYKKGEKTDEYINDNFNEVMRFVDSKPPVVNEFFDETKIKIINGDKA